MAPEVDELMKDAFGIKIPPLTELERRTAIAFMSTNPVYDHLQPLPETIAQGNHSPITHQPNRS